MLVVVVLTVLVTLLSVENAFAAHSFKLPPYIKTCSPKDPKFNECALKNGREIIPYIIPGDPAIRLSSLDPLLIDRIDIAPPGNTRSVGLRLTCNKCSIVGLKDAILNDIKINVDKKHLDVKVFVPRLTITGNYQVSGRVLVLPINGNGPGNITVSGVDFSAGLDWRLKRRKGEPHASFYKYNVHFDAKRLHIQLQNLFNGDRRLTDNMNNFLNENWREVMGELNPAISTTIGEIIKQILNTVFERVPFDIFFRDQ